VSVYDNLWEVYQSVKWIGCSVSDTRFSISDVSRINKLNWATARNCLECLKKLGLVDEQQEVVNGNYRRTFKGIHGRMMDE